MPRQSQSVEIKHGTTIDLSDLRMEDCCDRLESILSAINRADGKVEKPLTREEMALHLRYRFIKYVCKPDNSSLITFFVESHLIDQARRYVKLLYRELKETGSYEVMPTFSYKEGIMQIKDVHNPKGLTVTALLYSDQIRVASPKERNFRAFDK